MQLLEQADRELFQSRVNADMREETGFSRA
jgi:hypothetical protein